MQASIHMIQDDISNISLDGSNTSNTSVSSDIKITNVCEKEETSKICNNEDNTSNSQIESNVGSNVVNVNTSVDMYHSSIENNNKQVVRINTNININQGNTSRNHEECKIIDKVEEQTETKRTNEDVEDEKIDRKMPAFSLEELRLSYQEVDQKNFITRKYCFG